MKRSFIGLISAVLAVCTLLTPFTAEAAKKEKKRKPESAISTEYAQKKLFDRDQVHKINLLISQENWNTMIQNALQEEYAVCDVEIDGELIQNVAIRPKGNSSLKSISNQGSSHFSFKIEFDHNDPAVTYYGLDKLSLNNLGQDPSCMKDFIAYQLMNEMGVAAPLSSYAILQKNGQDFGLYLAVEAVEDAFCYRNYGEEYGKLYKPDSFAMDSLPLSHMLDYEEGSSLWVNEKIMTGEYYADATPGSRADILGAMLNSVFPSDMTKVAALNDMGEDVNAYQDLWEKAVFKIKQEDKERLVQSIRMLNSDQALSVLDEDALLNYFAVHNFVNNYDGYTSMFVHNFYLHEKDGKLSLVPWDYNLAFGSFTYETAVSSIINAESGFDPVPDTGNAMNVNQNMINYPIDTPVYSQKIEDRPLLNALLSDPDMLEQYHKRLDVLLQTCFENGSYAALIQQTYENIYPYVTQGLTFYSTEQFEKGAQAMRKYCQYRTESIRGQLDGKIPSTAEGQKENPESLIQPDDLNLTDLTDFGSLLPALNQDTVTSIIHVFLKDDFAYNTKGAVDAIHYYSKHPVKLFSCFSELMQIQVIRAMIMPKLMPILIGITAICILILVLIIRKIRNKKQQKLIPADAV